MINSSNFVLNEGIINEATYERLKSELRPTTSKVNEQKGPSQKEIMKEQQSTHPMENEEQTTRHTTTHKQHKRRRHTEEWKGRIVCLCKDIGIQRRKTNDRNS